MDVPILQRMAKNHGICIHPILLLGMLNIEEMLGLLQQTFLGLILRQPKECYHINVIRRTTFKSLNVFHKAAV